MVDLHGREAANGKASTAGWENFAKAMTVTTSLIVGVSGVLFSYFQYQKSLNDAKSSELRACDDNFKNAIQIITGGKVSSSDFKGAFYTYLERCYRKEQIDQLFVVATRSDVSCVCAPPTTPPSADVPVQNSAGVQKWVAVGFVGSDSNFTLPAGKSLATLSAGDLITSVTQVNIRRGAADWSSNLGVLPTGAQAKVEDIRILPAGQLRQVWARVSTDL